MSKKIFEKLRKIKLVITIVIVAGVVTHLILVYDAAKSIKVVEKRIEGVYLIKPNEYEVRFSLSIFNPKRDIEIDYINYDVYIEDDYLGNGEKPHFILKKGSSQYEFTLHFTSSSISSATKDLLLAGEANVKIKGEIMIPAKFFGTFTWKHIKIPYTINEKVGIG